MIPEYHKGKAIYGEHVARYEVVQELVTAKKVLDIACGSGYGTALIAKKAKHVTGVDVSEKAIAYAEEHYAGKNIKYLVGDCEAIPCADGQFDVVISFETIEHVKDYEQFLRECKRVLKPDGLLLLSTPNDLEFAEGNHFHLHEFERGELKKLIKKYFTRLKPYYQATWISNLIGEERVMTKEWDDNLRVVQAAPIRPSQFLYFYFLCANRSINETIDGHLVLGEHWSERAKVSSESISREIAGKYEQVLNELADIKRSRAYKLARGAGNFKSRVAKFRKK